MGTEVRKTGDTPSFRDSYNAVYRKGIRRMIEKLEADTTVPLARKTRELAELREKLKLGPVQDSCV